MVKNRTESILRNNLSRFKGHWYFLKLQVNSFAFTRSPADFIVLNSKGSYLVECKQIDLRKGNKFSFNRLSQENDLVNFQLISMPENVAWLFFGFIQKSFKESQFFLIPFSEFQKVRFLCAKRQFFDLEEFNKYFFTCRLYPEKGGVLRIEEYL